MTFEKVTPEVLKLTHEMFIEYVQGLTGEIHGTDTTCTCDFCKFAPILSEHPQLRMSTTSAMLDPCQLQPALMSMFVWGFVTGRQTEAAEHLERMAEL
jgi:hypothetical protein